MPGSVPAVRNAGTSFGPGRATLPLGPVLRVRPLAEFAPVLFRDLHAVELRRFLDVSERQVAILVGNALDLVETGQGIPDVRSVRERFLALFGEGVHTIRQIAAGGQVAVL